MLYNQFNLDSCMEYIRANKLDFEQSVDVLIKHHLDVTSEEEEEIPYILESAKIVMEHYKKYYSNPKNQKGREQYEQYEILYNQFIEKYGNTRN